MLSLQSYIFLADDDKDDRILLREALHEIKADIKLITAEHGKACMEMLHELTILPDLILLDINMPLKNGKECLAEIKRAESLASIPTAMYSTSTSQKDIEECYRAGANLYIIKPGTFSELTSVMARLLDLDWSQFLPQSRREEFVFNPQ